MVSRNFLRVADRVFRELRRDIRTMILFTISPTFVMILTAGILNNHPQTFNRVGLIVVGLFPTAPAFLFSAFAVQRERYHGTMEYLLTTPINKADVILGYIIAFTLPAIVQVGLTLSVTYGLLGLETAGAWWVVGLLALLSAVLGVALGLFAANFAHNEFQLTKILTATAAPHLMPSGLFRPYKDMPGWMQALASIAPWRYAVGAVAEFQKNAFPTSVMWFNLSVTIAIILLLFTVDSFTVLKRKSA
jgi:ABC-2 type transport system permease protein